MPLVNESTEFGARAARRLREEKLGWLATVRGDGTPVPVVASGGVGTLDHLVEGVIQGGASAVLAASIFHFGEFTIAQAKERLAQAGVPIRQISRAA